MEEIFREEWGRLLALLIGYFGDFDLAEEAAAEAFAIAAQRWPSDGLPANPAAWLITTARHRAIDRLRRDRALAGKLRLLAAELDTRDSVDTTAIPDERLELVFMCCHPALAAEAQVALTLRAVGGLSTEEIARAFLVLLPDQDRSRWDWRQIAEGRALLHRALDDARDTSGRYVIQAAIASLQAEEQLDWPQIAVLYTRLAERTGSPVVRLNRAVAVAEADGPAAALAIVDQLDLPDYQYWHSTRAELLRRLGRRDEARAEYQRALTLARTAPDRRFLERRIAES